MANAYHLFKAAEQLENEAGNLYRLLAERFAHDHAARDLFRRLAEEEDQHALRIRLLFAQYRKDPKLFEGAEALKTAGPDVDALLSELKALGARLEAGSWGSDLEEVQQHLAAVEERCAEVHAQFLARGASPEVGRFFEELARQDREHQRLLAALVIGVAV
jgi:rubrerythrin